MSSNPDEYAFSAYNSSVAGPSTSYGTLPLIMLDISALFTLALSSPVTSETNLVALDADMTLMQSTNSMFLRPTLVLSA